MSGYAGWDKFLTDHMFKALFSVPPAALGGIISTTNRIQVNSGITSTGMNGFSESGSPGEWDMAIGEVYGYRWWKLSVPARLAGWNGLLPAYREHAMQEHPLMGANNHFWSPGKQEAGCTASNSYPSWDHLLRGQKPLVHEPPEVREPCGCGFWAYFDPMLEVENVLGGFNGQVPTRSGNSAYLPVFGVVKGTGRVIIGEKGFRSQYAEIIGLCVSDSAKKFLKWDFTEGRGDSADDWDNTYYLRKALRGMYTSGGGMRGVTSGSSYRYYSYDSRTPEQVKQAPEEERLYRYATVEHLLSESYPGAKVFCDQADMVKYFPPDPNYGQRR